MHPKRVHLEGERGGGCDLNCRWNLAQVAHRTERQVQFVQGLYDARELWLVMDRTL